MAPCIDLSTYKDQQLRFKQIKRGTLDVFYTLHEFWNNYESNFSQAQQIPAAKNGFSRVS